MKTEQNNSPSCDHEGQIVSGGYCHRCGEVLDQQLIEENDQRRQVGLPELS